MAFLLLWSAIPMIVVCLAVDLPSSPIASSSVLVGSDIFVFDTEVLEEIDASGHFSYQFDLGLLQRAASQPHYKEQI